MKINAFLPRLVILIVLVFISIECNKSPVDSINDTNLLLNESFETDHTPTLEGWRLGNPQLTQLINEAPPDGGNWSLQLTADWAPTSGYAFLPITNVKSGDIVRLSAYVLANGPLGSRGFIYLAYNNHIKSASSSDTVWNEISVTDTLNLGPNDTLKVFLSAPITEIVPYQQLFDLVRLEKLEN